MLLTSAEGAFFVRDCLAVVTGAQEPEGPARSAAVACQLPISPSVSLFVPAQLGPRQRPLVLFKGKVHPYGL